MKALDNIRTNNDQSIFIENYEDKKKISLVKKATGKWAKVAAKYMEKYPVGSTERQIAANAENMAIVIKENLSVAYLRETKTTLLAALDSKKRICGVALASFEKDKTFIQNIVVNPRVIKTFHKNSKTSGVGKALIKNIAQRTLDNQGKTIYLHSLKLSENFYKNLGFENDSYNQKANSAAQAMKLEQKGIQILCGN